MTRFKLIGVAFVVSAIQLTAASAQVSEPAAAAARDPNFSIYSSGPAGFAIPAARAQALPGDISEPVTPVRTHRAHRRTTRY